MLYSELLVLITKSRYGLTYKERILLSDHRGRLGLFPELNIIMSAVMHVKEMKRTGFSTISGMSSLL